MAARPRPRGWDSGRLAHHGTDGLIPLTTRRLVQRILAYLLVAHCIRDSQRYFAGDLTDATKPRSHPSPIPKSLNYLTKYRVPIKTKILPGRLGEAGHFLHLWQLHNQNHIFMLSGIYNMSSLQTTTRKKKNRFRVD